MVYFSVSRISGILRHLVSGDSGFEDRAEIDIPDRAIPTDEVVVHVVFALTDTIGGLEIGQGIMNAVAGCFISFDKLDLIQTKQKQKISQFYNPSIHTAISPFSRFDQAK